MNKIFIVENVLLKQYYFPIKNFPFKSAFPDYARTPVPSDNKRLWCRNLYPFGGGPESKRTSECLMMRVTGNIHVIETPLCDLLETKWNVKY